MKDIISDDDARRGIKEGIDKVAKTVGITAGPKGRNVVIAQGFGASINTNDGVTVARSISLSDQLQDIGAHMVKEVATNTEEATGDGTTTSTLLLQGLVSNGLKKLSTGADPNMLKTGMAKAANAIVEKLDEMSVPVKGDNDIIKKVATISSNNDDELGSLIAEAFYEAGEAGEVAVTESGTFETRVEVVEGIRFDKGYVHRVFINNMQTSKAELESPNILVTDKKINSSRDILPILEKLAGTDNSKLLIISDDIDYDVLNTIAMSKAQGKIDVTCVKAPGYGDSRIEMLEDIAAIVGATLISSEKTLKEVEIEDLGMADNVYAGKDETSIVGGYGQEELIENRIDNIVSQLENTDLEDYPKKVLQKRLASLRGGIAVLYVGAASDTELAEKKYRIEDAIGATKSAISEGIVPGGGVALIRAVSDKEYLKLGENDDENMGIQIVVEAVKRPFNKILENAGMNPDVVLSEILEKNTFYGLNVKTGEYGDLLKLGVVDPVKVTKVALLNSVSVAGMFLTTEAVVFDKEE